MRHPILEADFERVFEADLPWSSLADRTILVTGASGLIGSYMVEALLYRNEHAGRAQSTIVALVRDHERGARRFAVYLDRPDFRLLVQDVSTPLPDDLEVNYVIHAAGNATPKAFGADPVGTYRSAVLGTHFVMEAAARSRCEGFLLLSSGSVHGAIERKAAVIDERTFGVVDPLDPYACYAESKRMAETICASWTRQFGVRTRIARLGHTYGPGLRRDDNRAFAEFAFSVVDRRDIVLHSDGAAVRYYCYLSDAADGLFRTLLRGSDGEAYLVTNAAEYCSVRELATMLAGMFPDRRIAVRFDEASKGNAIANQDPLRQVDTSKLAGLGWVANIGIEEGFRRTLSSML